MLDQQTGKYIVLFGLALIVIGAIVYFFNNRLGWIGHLPGDIAVEKENFRLYIPIVTMLLFSAVLSLILYLVRRFF